MKNKIQNIFWFRNDLRLNDNLPLYESSNFKNVAAIYIYDTDIVKSQDFGKMHLDFINDSLKEISLRFKQSGSYLNI